MHMTASHFKATQFYFASLLASVVLEVNEFVELSLYRRLEKNIWELRMKVI